MANKLARLEDIITWGYMTDNNVVFNLNGTFQKTYVFRGADGSNMTENDVNNYYVGLNNIFLRMKDNYYVFSLTDITKLKEKSNLLEYQATHDKLTGLYNRNRFDEIYEKEIKRAKRYENDLSMILFDVDNFKQINDNYGHQTGDEVLKEIAEITLNSVREQDISVRWGGEEFLVLLPQTNLLGAVTAANKIRSSIEKNPISSHSLNITASFGVSQLLEDDELDFISKTDKLLYEAKKTGKNKVVS